MPARDTRAVGLLTWLIAVWLAGVAAWLTWTPFELSRTPNTLEVFPGTSVTDIAGNLLLLVPFGAIVVFCNGRYSVRRAATLAAVLSASLELGQIWIFGRTASLWDVVPNTAGAAVAAYLAVRLTTRIRVSRIVTAMAGAVFAVTLAYVLYASRVYAQGMRLSAWDGSFQIAAGDEVGGARRYIGETSGARICAGEARERFCAGPDASPLTRVSLARLAERSQIVEVEADVRSGSSAPGDLRRIVTFSRGPFERNITLGQQGESLVLRLRTPMNGENGLSNELVSHGVLSLGVPTSIRVRYDHARVTTRLHSAQRTRVIEHIFDGLAAPLLVRGSGHVTPAQSSRARGLTIVVLAIPLILAGAWPILGLRAGVRSREFSVSDEGGT